MKLAGRKALTAKERAKALVVLERDLSIAARAVAKLPFIRGHKFSHVVTYHYDRITYIEKTYGVAPTLTKSGAYMLRDAVGVRTLTGREVAKLQERQTATELRFLATLGATLEPEQAARLAAMLPRPQYYDRNRGSAYLSGYTDRILGRMGGAQLP